ncbi:Zinc finger SWIM domain-containing protein 8 [Armadillidium nasatum]|uniref:Zinc finger SWIM domain-containing protein 8 n=1 Tax=Armadillidium nasatum TaxID=96803 RepID=A0A5N5T593_9CRUS|nr:Zinc finger SWIM domain-containing protein 8 [Armadillidium nasatum]
MSPGICIFIFEYIYKHFKSEYFDQVFDMSKNEWLKLLHQWATPGFALQKYSYHASIKSLAELCARTVAAHIPFEVVEQMMPVVPEQIQLWIAYWSFPDNEEDIRLYSCLANGNADEFVRGENLYKHTCVEEMLQIGFHLSATVNMQTGSKGKYKVAVAFDRGRITTCNCTCSSTASWCSHVVAVCLHRIHQPKNVKLRAPVSESLSRLQRDQLQKFAQYLISELPQQILPTAQRLIDEILSSQSSDINTVSGAPDPTAGASASEQTAWWLDENNLHENIHKILVKFCVPSPMVFSDVNYLSSTAPPVAAEWQSLLRPLRGREPEGMWNLLSIVREMFKRHDHNAIPLLEVITEECLATEKILVWWVNTRVALHSVSSGHGGKNNVNSNSHGSQYACSSLCDEIVILWRLAALNPALSPNEREMLMRQFKEWHLKVMEKVAKSKEAGNSNPNNRESKKGGDIEVFPGFKPAIEACLLDWDDYPLPGITYSPAASRYYCPVMCCKHDPNHDSHAGPISAPQARLPPQYVGIKRNMERRIPGVKGATAHWVVMDGASAVMGPSRSQRSSSVSSEGFCDNDMGRDSDSSQDNRSTERDSGQVSRQNSREDARGVNMYQEYIREREANLRLGNIHPQLSAEDQDQGCNVDEGDSDQRGRGTQEGRSDQQRIGIDGYRMYVYNPHLVSEIFGVNIQQGLNDKDGKPVAEKSNDTSNGGEKGQDVFAGIKKLEDSLEILFSRAEGLHAHGHNQEASRLAVQLAGELLAHPPNLMIEVATPVAKSKRKKINPASHQLTCLASATLTKCAFLCAVLAEDPENTHLAFQVALFGLEMPRPPASTKPLEVKLANQESDLVSLLKRLPLGPKELAVIREKAELLRTGKHNTRGDALLPLMLAAFIFDALVSSAYTRGSIADPIHLYDENLGFQAAVAALAMKANVSEADHPLLCEGTRRQRGELALTLLTYYKDDQEHLAIIMDKFLDKEVHQMYKTPSLPTYYATKHSSVQGTGNNTDSSTTELAHNRSSSPTFTSANTPPTPLNVVSASALPSSSVSSGWTNNACQQHHQQQQQHQQEPAVVTSDSTWVDDYKEWEENNLTLQIFLNGDLHGLREVGQVPIPDLLEILQIALDPLAVEKRGANEGNKPGDSPPLGLFIRPVPHSLPESLPAARPQPPYGKVIRYKGKRAYPTVPNQPSEASAYFMFELAKTVLSKAGGTSSTSLFKQPPTNTQNHRGPHRALQMCAFQIGLYALGLNNCVSPNWLSRTYSSHVSWISNQATEIGASALSFLIDTWEGHLTPQEAASVADKASRGRDANTIRQAARLALSCLPHAHALNPNEIQRAIVQCKELSSNMLEGACLAVEKAAKGGGVYPEVLFYVAHCWDDLYETRNKHQSRQSMRRGLQRQLEEQQQQQQHQHHPPPQVVDDHQQQSNAHQDGHSGNINLIPPVPPVVTTGNSGNTSVTSSGSHQSQHQQQAQVSSIENVAQLHPSVSVGISVTTIHATNGVPTYPIGAPGTYGIPGLPYPLGYNYIQSLPPSVSCINPQLPVQMFIQPQGVPFNGTQGGVSQGLLPPPPLQSLQYYPPVSIPSSLAQGSNGSVSVQQGMGSSQLQGGSQPPLTPPNLPPGSVQTTMPQATGLIQTSPPHPSQQDDRPQAKYARNPPYGEDVKWLLGVAKKLGTQYLHQFCLCSVNSVVSPFVLYDLAVEVAAYLSRNSPPLYHQPLRSPILQPLVQKCQQICYSSQFSQKFI